jgi:uncharacterized membrane protein YbaN (DUF454 family)
MSDPQPPKPPPEAVQPATPAALRPVYFVAGIVLLGVGIAGYILPVLPGTIWMILAVACFARSSPKMEHWLLTHPVYGPPLVAWRKNGAIPFKIKLIAIGSMLVSQVIVCLSPAPEWVDWLVAVIIVSSALFVGTRPNGASIIAARD